MKSIVSQPVVEKRMTLQQRKELMEKAPWLEYEIWGLYTFRFKDFPTTVLKPCSVGEMMTLSDKVYEYYRLRDHFKQFNPGFLEDVINCGSPQDVYILYIIYRKLHKLWTISISSKTLDTKNFAQAVSEADRLKNLLSRFKSHYIRKTDNQSWEIFSNTAQVCDQYIYDSCSYENKEKKYFIANKGNFRKVVLRLGLSPVIVDKNSLLSVMIMGYLYRMSPFVEFHRQEKQIETKTESLMSERASFIQLALNWGVIYRSTYYKGDVEIVKPDMYKMFSAAANATIEYHWVINPKIKSTSAKYMDDLARHRAISNSLKKKVSLANVPDVAKYTMDVPDLGTGIQVAALFAHIKNFVSNMKHVASVQDLVVAVIESLSLLAINTKFASLIVKLIERMDVMIHLESFVTKILDVYSSAIDIVKRRKISPKPIGETVIMTESVEVYTGYGDVFKALKNSDFYEQTVALITTIKFSIIINAFLGWVNPSGTFRLVVNTFEDILRNSGTLSNIHSIWTQLFTDVIPALITGNPDCIQPSLFYKRVELIERAICLASNNDDNAILEVCREWLDEQIEPVNLYAEFNDILTDMRNFLVKMNPGGKIVNLAKLMNSIVMAQICITGQALYGQNRREPFCVGLHGAPGVGKTTAIQKITMWLHDPCKLSMRKNASGDFIIPHIVPVTDTTKFCDNVNNGSQVIVFDDLGVTHDKNIPAGANAYSLFMQVQGNVPVPIPRSDIESKKNQFFNNKLTFVTSNSESFGAMTMIKDMDAFRRRIHANIHFCLEDKADYNSRFYEVDLYHCENRQHTMVVCREDGPPSLERGLKNDNALMLILQEHCKVYIKTRDDYIANSRGLVLCSLCKKIRHPSEVMQDGCSCGQIVNRIEPIAGLWSSEDTVASTPVSNLYLQILAEETLCGSTISVGSYLVNAYTLLGPKWSPLISSLYVSLVREMLEWYFKGTTSPLRLIIFTGIGMLDPMTAIICHMMFDTPYIISAKWDTVIEPFNVVYNYVDDKLVRCINYVKYLLTPVWYAKHVISNVSQNCKELILHETTYRVGKFIGVSLVGITILVGLNKLYTYYSTSNKPTQLTSLGDAPLEGDVKAHRDLCDMVGGVNDINEIDITGTTNDYRAGFKPVYKKSNGNIPKSVGSCLVTILTTIYDSQDKVILANMRTSGVFANGYVYTCGHTIGPKGYLEDNNYVAKSMFHFNNTEQTKYFYVFVKGGPWCRGKHDTLRFPFTNDGRKTLHVSNNFEPQPNDKFLVGSYTDQFNVVAKTNGCKSEYNGIYYDEPAGGIAIDYLSKQGDSGLPVYLVHRDGESVQPIIVGIVSRKSMTLGGKAVFVPLDVFDHYTNDVLVSEVTTDLVVKYFAEKGYPIQEEVFFRNSISRHIDDISQIGEFVGSTYLPTQRSTSSFYKTKFYDQACELVPETSTFTVPDLQKFVESGVYHDHMLSCLRQMSATGQITNESVFLSASDVVYDIMKRDLDLSQWKPISTNLVFRGTQRTNPINLKAAVGFPHSGIVKNDIVVGSIEEPMFTEEFSKEIALVYEKLDRGELCLNISKAAVKDEIISKKKNKEMQARIFFAGNLPFLFVCRQMLSTFMDICTSSRSKLFAKIGMNAIGFEFDAFLRELYVKVHGSEKDFDTKKCWSDGDFSKYDKTLLLFKYAVMIIWRLAQIAPHFINNNRDMKRLNLVLQSLMKYVVILDGEVFILGDKMPSGMWATSLINCICEMIIEVLMFYYLIHISYVRDHKLKPFETDFVSLHRYNHSIDKIAVGNYGDDNIKAIADDYIKYYNHDDIMSFSRWIHMGMTPARKHEKELACKNVMDIMFLKRVPVYNEYLQRLVGRLEIASIGKMLAFTDSHSPDWEKSVLENARRELAFHGEELYYKFIKIFNQPYVDIKETLNTIDGVKWSPEDKTLVTLDE